MALPPEALRVVHLGLQTAEHAGCESQRVLSLGYPDILASPEQLGALIGAELVPELRYREDSEAIARWHQVGGTGAKVVEAENFFALLGYDLEVLDIAQARGGEILHDLNQPVPPELHRRYALVIDPGTLEHCFEIAQAAKNIVEMVAAHGCVFHGNPLNMFNHGFYNLSPTWYHDFYAANGFELVHLQAIAEPAGSPKRIEVPATARFAGVPENCALYVLARKTSDVAVRWPVQSKYVSNPGLKG